MDTSKMKSGDKVIFVGYEDFLKGATGEILMNDGSDIPYLVEFPNVPNYGTIEWWCVVKDVVPYEEPKNEVHEDTQLSFQFGGDHYKSKAIQPIEYIMANDLDYCEGNVVKYITRWKDKGGLEDLNKARHYIDFLIEKEQKQ